MTVAEQVSTKLRPYPAYKDSGVPWMGEVPVGWEVRRLKHACKFNSRVWPEDTDSDQEISYIEISDVDGLNKPVPTRMAFGQAPSRARRIVKQDDVIISTVRTYLRAVQAIDDDLNGCTVSTGFAVLTANDEVVPKFLGFALLSEGFIQTVIANSRGVSYPAIEASKLADLPCVLPPLSDQPAIAAFLDRETARIDELLREQGALLEDLGEKRRAVTTAAVTGTLLGYTGTTRTVENIGTIPVHWKVLSLKRVAQVRGGVTKGRDLQGKAVLEVPYLRVANVQDGYLDLEDVTTILIGTDELERYSLQPGDVLMNEGGDNDKLGRGAVWRGQITPCVHQNHVFAVRPHAVEPDWLALVNASDYAKFFFFINSKQSTNLASISSSTIKELPVVLPPQEERVHLLAEVAKQHAHINTLVQEVRASIEDMRLHRSALITAAVTGKIDVRHLEPA